MKERPILFSGSMVRAIREGRKTQTRRVIKPQPECLKDLQAIQYHLATGEPLIVGRGCPYGKPGDRLWVKETFTLTQHNLPVYRADSRDKDGKFWPSVHSDPDGVLWKPSIYMPRWASRITLEIESVRGERLQEISNEDCWNEGMCDATNPELKANRKWFSELWESINGVGSWDLNQWVWVIEFKEVKP